MKEELDDKDEGRLSQISGQISLLSKEQNKRVKEEKPTRVKEEMQDEPQYFADFQDATYGADWKNIDPRLFASFAIPISWAQMESTVASIETPTTCRIKSNPHGMVKLLGWLFSLEESQGFKSKKS